MRVIFGFEKTYEELLQLSGIGTLEERRKNAFIKLARSMSESERYRDWFPRNARNVHNLRDPKTFIETFARTDRLYNSPLYSMRRVLNEENE